MSGLQRLEYRGYDSAGIALTSRGRLRVHKSAGKLVQLAGILPARCPGRIGIAHTRWATHGAPTDVNAHPHCSGDGRLALVHNGIIENAAGFAAVLAEQGVVLRSETDSEVLVQLIMLAPGSSLVERVRHVLRQVHGTYGIAVMDVESPDTLVVARNGSPVILGIGEKEMFVASDVAALARHTSQAVHLDDGEIAVLTPRGFEASTLAAQPASKSPLTLTATDESYELGEHRHFMHKEILEQPEAVARTLSGRLDHRFASAHLGGLNLDPRALLSQHRVKILGCGSAFYAGMAGAHLIESLARLPASAEPAAEFRYRDPVIEHDTLYVAVSQSGETLDTLMAVQEIRRRGGTVLGIVNVVGSSIAREVDGGIYMHAGPEVSVASTKAFTCSLVCLALLALHLGRIRDLSPQQGQALVQALDVLPETLQQALAHEQAVQALAQHLADVHSAYFIGRASGFPVACEGAQKLKEIAYIHAEAYPASELKHGPLALVGPETPTVVVLPDDGLLEKSLSSLSEIRARSGPTIALHQGSTARMQGLADHELIAPPCHPRLAPLVMGIPLQLLAYHCALTLGRDVDRPRNLAKSVTVE
jgi:glucosamine--fructose-6-phosphate aminotransferase (isomerizing)